MFKVVSQWIIYSSLIHCILLLKKIIWNIQPLKTFLLLYWCSYIFFGVMRSIHPSSDCTGRNEHLQICRLVEMRPYLQDTPIKKLFRRWRLLQTSHKKHQLAEWLERHGQLKPCLEAGSSQLAVVWFQTTTPFAACQPHFLSLLI